jgi:hypothetical protein
LLDRAIGTGAHETAEREIREISRSDRRPRPRDSRTSVAPSIRRRNEKEIIMSIAMNPHASQFASPQVVIVDRKSVGLAFLLALVFGPLGMLYTTVAGAIIMLIVNAVVGTLTVGLGLVITWPLCVVWSCLAAASHNRRAVPLT